MTDMAKTSCLIQQMEIVFMLTSTACLIRLVDLVSVLRHLMKLKCEA